MYEGRCARTPFSFVVAGCGRPDIMAEEFDVVECRFAGLDRRRNDLAGSIFVPDCGLRRGGQRKRHPCVQSPPVDNSRLSTGGDFRS